MKIRLKGTTSVTLLHFSPEERAIITPLTLDEHRELGSELRRTRARLHQLCAMVAGVYGPNSYATFSFQKAADAVDRLCREMQTQAARDLPGYQIDEFYTS